MRAAILIFLWSMLTGHALSEPVDGGRAVVDLIAEREAVQPGETFFAAFDMVLDEGWHVYWRNPGDAGLPPAAKWDQGSDQLAGEFVWPIPHELPVVAGQIMDYGYDKRLVLPFPVTVPDDAAGLVTLAGELDYLICEEICIPEAVTFQLTLPVVDTLRINETGGQLIADWVAKAPTPLTGQAKLTEEGEAWRLSLADPQLATALQNIRFFPFENEITHAADQPAEFGPSGASLRLVPGYDPELPPALSGVTVIERADGTRIGYEVSATPGPVLPGTRGGASPSSGLAGGVNWLSISLMALAGGLILNLMPCVLPVLSIKAVGMVEAAASGNAARIRHHGLLYALGVLASFLAIAAAFVALRATGEFLSIGFQLQYPIAVALLALLMFAIGLWLLGMFELGTSVQGVGSGLADRGGSTGAFFTGVLAAVVGAPCIGPFLGVALGAVITEPAPIVFLVFGLVGIGLALPFLILSFLPGLQRLMPKPGAWMERLKQFFAFPMFLTGAWLLSVLGDQAGMRAVAWTLAGAIALAFGVWALRQADGGWKTTARLVGGLGLLAGIGLPVWASLSDTSPAGTGSTAYANIPSAETWSPERVSEILASGQGVFVDFTASWCATCQLNKATTLKRDDVQTALQEAGIVFMVADFTNQDAAIADELKARGRPGVPMYLLYAPGNQTPKILPQILSADLIQRELSSLPQSSS